MNREIQKRAAHAANYGWKGDMESVVESIKDLEKLAGEDFEKFLNQYTRQEIAMDTIKNRGIKPLKRTKKQLEEQVDSLHRTIAEYQRGLELKQREFVDKASEVRKLENQVSSLKDALKHVCQSMYKVVETI